MTFLDFEIEEKSVAAAKFIGETRRGLVMALLHAKMDDPSLSQAKIAKILKMDKATLSRILNGQSNMTLRTIAEIAWSMGLAPEVHFQSLGDHNSRSNREKYSLSGSSGAVGTQVSWTGDDQKSTTFLRSSIKNVSARHAA